MRQAESGRTAGSGGVNIEVLRQMNDELRSFLEHSLSSESFWEKWTAIDFPMKRIRCWEIKSCNREDCPSYRDVDCRCWLRVGTLCGGEVQGDFARKYRSCFSCEVMDSLENDLIRSLYENVNILIHHLKSRDQKLVTTSITDQLTGAYNRTYFNEYIDKRLAQAGRAHESLSFIMVDLDGFKGLNDTHGHLAGDTVLSEASALLRSVIRRSDLLFRYGGDEFLIVLPQADCGRAESVTGRILQSVEAWNRANKRFGGFRLSLSTGCSTWSQGDDLHTKIQEADALMYRDKKQKKSGRSA